MAFTVSAITDSVFGNMRMKIVNITPDAAAGNVDMAMSGMVAALVSMKSMATIVSSAITGTVINTPSVPRYAVNSGQAGTALLGTIGFSSCVVNDVYTVIAFGYDM